MMEPPRKRMRLFQSVDVDEDNPDYIHDKQKSEAVLKNKFENIFAKYENMPESRSDEIDMLTGDIVVDRGHVRSLQTNKRTWEAAQFLGDLMADRVGDTFEELDEDSEDELAPSEASRSPEAVDPGQRKPDVQRPQAPSDRLPRREQNREETTELPINPAQVASPLILDQTQLLNALNPALQLAQFPQTPLDVQNQNALLMGLGRVVLQAVTQALPVALSNHLGNASGAIAPQPAITPASNYLLTPASDPKWACPPLPQLPPSSDFADPSPVPKPTDVRKKRKAFEKNKSSRPAKKSVISKRVPPVSAQRLSTTIPIATPPQEDERTPKAAYLHDSPMSGLPFSTPQFNYTSHARKYFFDEKDNQHIIAQRTINELTFSQIKNSRPKWRGYPVSAFVSHWNFHLKRRTVELRNNEQEGASTSGLDHTPTVHQGTQGVSTPPKRKRGRPNKVPLNLNADRIRQLPTPTATEHSDPVQETQDSPVTRTDSTNDHLTYSQEDLELLSLAGDEQEERNDLMEAEDILGTSMPLEDPVVPSVESGSPATDLDLLDDDDDEEPITSHPVVQTQQPRIVTAIDTHVTIADLGSSTQKRKKQKEVINYAVDSDDEDDLILVPTCESESKTRSSPVQQSHAEFDPTPTPEIKREPLTPGPFSLLAAPSPITPRSAPPNPAHSSATKDSSKLSRSEMSRRVRAQWAKWGRAKPPHVARQRPNLQMLKRRSEEDSEDELA
jgi:hypothetical protein